MKIGAFARACGVNMQTLRYYDKIGLFPADRVDSDSGYRYYRPERIHDFETITELKGLGFSLEEIKRYLSSPEATQKLLLSERRRALRERIELEQARILRIDERDTTKEEKNAYFSSFLNLPFEDDPAVIGKWTLCGAMPKNAAFTDEESLAPCDTLLREIYFLPGGGHVWNYFWSRGVFYRLIAGGVSCVASTYRLWENKDSQYLALSHPEEREAHVYRRVDGNAYTEKQTYAYRDEVDLPFVSDENVLGAWDTVALVSCPEEFSPINTIDAHTDFYIKEIAFYERGICRKLLKNSGAGYPLPCLYTKGFILDRENSRAEHYEIREAEGERYLIIEHKSEDYAYLGQVFSYYVFKKRKENL